MWRERAQSRPWLPGSLSLPPSTFGWTNTCTLFKKNIQLGEKKAHDCVLKPCTMNLWHFSAPFEKEYDTYTYTTIVENTKAVFNQVIIHCRNSIQITSAHSVFTHHCRFQNIGWIEIMGCQCHLLWVFFFCIVNVGLINISTSSFRETRQFLVCAKKHSAGNQPFVMSQRAPIPLPGKNGFNVRTLMSESNQCRTYIDSTKEVKGVRVGEGGFLSGLPVLCDERHGVHRELGW